MSLVTSTPTSNFVAAEVNRLIILRAVFGWSGLTSAATAKSRRSAAVPGRSKGRTAMRLGCFDGGLIGNVAAPGDGRAPGSFPFGPLGRTPCQNHFAMDDWGERGRPACGFGRRAQTIVGQISLTGFRRDAENGNRDGRAPRPGATQ